MSPKDAMPITTVTKITGAVTVLMSCRNASASHFESVAGPGATRPKMMPAVIATSTQNHSWRFMTGGLLSSLSYPAVPAARVAKLRWPRSPVVVVVVLVEDVVLVA
jgi:hypothetical protein